MLRPQSNILFNRYLDATVGCIEDPGTLSILPHCMLKYKAHQPLSIQLSGLLLVVYRELENQECRANWPL